MLAIFAPYDASETCSAAVRLADVLTLLGHNVVYIATSSNKRVVSPVWDHRVRSIANITSLLPRIKSFIHFGLTTHYLVKCNEAHKHTLVLAPNQEDVHNLHRIVVYGKVVCPSLRASSILSQWKDRCRLRNVPPIYWSHWSWPTVEPKPNRSGALIVLDRAVTDNACVLFRAVAELIKNETFAHITLGLCNSVSAEARRCINWLTSHCPRFSVTPVARQAQLSSALANHSCLLWPASRSDFGYPIIRAHAAQVPVVCCDAPPFDEWVHHGHDGIMSRTCVHFDHIKRCRACPSVEDLVEAAEKVESTKASFGTINNVRCVKQLQFWDTLT